MPDIFPKWFKQMPRNLLIGGITIFVLIVAGCAYYFTPKYTRTGYGPRQPVGFSHKTHVAQVELDCRYCHRTTEKSWYASIPATSTCLSCHNQILRDDPRLALVRESGSSGKPIPWVQVHKLPDDILFNHAVHTQRGVGCIECHGPVHTMDETRMVQPLNMAFCLDCHKDPAPRLRPTNAVTDMLWLFTQPGITNDPKKLEMARREFGEKMARDLNIEKLTTCSTCHK